MSHIARWPRLFLQAGLIACLASCLASASAQARDDNNRQRGGRDNHGRGHEGRRQAPPPLPAWRGRDDRTPYRYDRGEQRGGYRQNNDAGPAIGGALLGLGLGALLGGALANQQQPAYAPPPPVYYPPPTYYAPQPVPYGY